MKLLKYIMILVSFGIFLYGCSASEITEEYGEMEPSVEYTTTETPAETGSEVTPNETVKETTKKTTSTGVTITQESQKTEQIQPEYIPQGPPTPPPPPSKTTFTETKLEEVQTPPTPTMKQYQYKVQVFAFKSRLNAETEAQKIRNRLPDQKVYVEWSDNLFKVRLGIYSKWEHAKSIKDAIYNLGYTDSFIVTEDKP